MSLISKLKAWFSLFRKPKIVDSKELVRIQIDPALLAKLKKEGRTTCTAEELNDAISLEDAIKIQQAVFSAYCESAGNEIDSLADENGFVRLNVTFHYPYSDEALATYSNSVKKEREELDKDLRDQGAWTKRRLEETFTDVDDNFDQTLREQQYVEENNLTDPKANDQRIAESYAAMEADWKTQRMPHTGFDAEAQAEQEIENARKLGLLADGFEGTNYESALAAHDARVKEAGEGEGLTGDFFVDMNLKDQPLEFWISASMKERLDKGEHVPMKEIHDSVPPGLKDLFVKWLEAQPLRGTD